MHTSHYNLKARIRERLNFLKNALIYRDIGALTISSKYVVKAERLKVISNTYKILKKHGRFVVFHQYGKFSSPFCSSPISFSQIPFS